MHQSTMNDSQEYATAIDLLAIAHRSIESQAKGEAFNILTIIRRGHLEVMTHPPIIAELLRPTGSHDHGAQFLGLFLKQLGITDFHTSNATTREEQTLGELGRIDLVLTDRHGRQIFIENKIGANLREKQLERYQSANPHATIVYLTLHGDAPHGTDLSHVPNLKTASYREDISCWLSECLQVAADCPIVHESLLQYRNLVLTLTDQNPSPTMTQNIADAVLSDGESLSAFYALMNSKTEVMKRLAKLLVSKVKTKLNERIEFLSVIKGSGWAYDEFKFLVFEDESVELHGVFGFESADCRNCYFGFHCARGSLSEDAITRLRSLFTHTFEQQLVRNDKWPAWAYWHEKNWDKTTWGRLLHDGDDTLPEEVAEQLLKLKSLGERFVSDH